MMRISPPRLPGPFQTAHNGAPGGRLCAPFFRPRTTAPQVGACALLFSDRAQRRPGWAPVRSGGFYQVRQDLGPLTIGAFALHPNAFWNSGILETTPFTRNSG